MILITIRIELTVHNRIAMFFLLRYALTGFEPGSSALPADSMTTAPRRGANFSYCGFELDELFCRYQCLIESTWWAPPAALASGF
jgi:hypothetical protein